VVTIDDVLDYLLPDDWRSTDSDEHDAELQRARANDTSTAAIPIKTTPIRGRRAPHGTR